MQYPITSLLVAFKQSALRLWAEQNVASLYKDAPIESIITGVENKAIRSSNPQLFLCQLFLQLPFDDAEGAQNIIDLAANGTGNEQRLAALSLAGVLPTDAIATIQAGVAQLNDCMAQFDVTQAEFNPTTNYLQYTPPANAGSYTPPAPLVLQSSQNPAPVAGSKPKTGEQFANIANGTLSFVNALGGLVDKVGALKNGSTAGASAGAQTPSNMPNATASDNNAIKWLLGILGGLVVVVLGVVLYKKYS